MQPNRRPPSRMEAWQRRVLVTLGTLVVIVAATAVALIIRNALGEFGLTDPSDTSQQPVSDTGADQTSGTGASPTSTETAPVGTQSPTIANTQTTAASVPSLPPPPATFVEEDITATDLRLQPEGLGPVPFGTGVDRTLAVITSALGLPDADSGWLPADTQELQCPGQRARRVTWGDLSIFFSDGPTDWGPDLREHFFSYVYSLGDGAPSSDGPTLRTSEGLGLGDTLSRSSSVYGESSISLDESSTQTVLEVDVPGPGYLRGTFSGDTEEDYLVSIQGGNGCRP